MQNEISKNLIDSILSKIEDRKSAVSSADRFKLETFANYLKSGLSACRRAAETVDGENLSTTYLGAGSISAKLVKSAKHNYFTYGIYLAPANMSGFNVCPRSENCKDFCLVNSGRARIEAKAGKKNINAARVRRTLLFFKRRVLFVATVCLEIARAYSYAVRHEMNFAIRLNCTSDINPRAFAVSGLNLLDLFPDFIFYDYTKVFNRFELLTSFANYDLTFSFDGCNWDSCKKVLNRGGRVAVVFDCINQDNENYLPNQFAGLQVVSGDNYDMRFLDPENCVIGLTYHKTANDYKKGVYVRPVTPFVINEFDPRIK